MNLMVAFFAGAGAAAWVYSKVMRSTGGNNQSSLIVAGSAGAAAFVVMTIIMNSIS
jgi:hypothetical protein